MIPEYHYRDIGGLEVFCQSGLAGRKGGNVTRGPPSCSGKR